MGRIHCTNEEDRALSRLKAMPTSQVGAIIAGVKAIDVDTVRERLDQGWLCPYKLAEARAHGVVHSAGQNPGSAPEDRVSDQPMVHGNHHAENSGIEDILMVAHDIRKAAS